MSRLRRMQLRIDRLDGAVAGMPRVRQSASLLMLVATWGVMTVYDLLYPPGFLRAIMPLAGLVPAFIRLLQPTDLEDDDEAYRSYLRVAVLSGAMALACMIAGALPFTFDSDGTPVNTWSFIVGRLASLVPLLFVMPVAESVLSVLRYRIRRGVPRTAILIAYGLLVAVALEQLFPTTRLSTPEPSTPAMVVAGMLGLGALILSMRARWIVNLRKRQKLILLVLSFIGMPIGATLISLQDQSEYAAAIYSFFPGLHVLVFGVGIALTTMQFAFFVRVLMALPTAEAIDRRSAEISSLSTFARLLTRSFDMRDLVDTSLAVTCDVTGGTAAWIELSDGTRTPEVHCGTVQRIPEQRARALMAARLGDTTLAAAVRQQRSIQLIDRLPGAPAPASGPGDLPVSSIAAAPLVAGDAQLGTLYVTRGNGEEFDREHLSILKTISDQIALSIEHARLISSSIERERIEQEMLIARDLQERLLPRSMPRSSWYEIAADSRPAHLVGGDYYDLVSFRDGTLGIIVADVSGKGASAALYMGMIKGIIQAVSGSTDDPRELLSKINVALHGQIDQRWFATMTCAQVIEGERTLRIARAGHCPTLVVTSGEARYLRSRGLGLSLARPLLFERHLELDEAHFGPDDYVVFFSDGLVESRAPDGEEFGYDRLQSAVAASAATGASPSEMRSTVFSEIASFTRGELPSDDMTIVVLRWKSAEVAGD